MLGKNNKAKHIILNIKCASIFTGHDIVRIDHQIIAVYNRILLNPHMVFEFARINAQIDTIKL